MSSHTCSMMLNPKSRSWQQSGCAPSSGSESSWSARKCYKAIHLPHQGSPTDRHTPEIAEGAVQQAAHLTVVQVDVPLVLEAISRCREHVISFWDSLIIGAALASDCGLLLSEDLNDGQYFGQLRIMNPFG